ncbi:MAG: cation diffusion facilitator family transporter [Chloroflexi bacterium]|nr:cation diffusion facilitator family transporter [Chloroflexota bacterium]
MQPHDSQTVEKRFIFSISLTLVILIVEALGGLWTGSLALLSDSAHVFMDIFALGLSYLAIHLSALPADDRHTYGYHRLEVLAALANGLTLGVISLGIFYEAYQRWLSPAPVKTLEMLLIAVLGLLVNVSVALILRGGSDLHRHQQVRSKDLNVESAFLHVLTDAIASIGVIAAAGIIWSTGWLWVDPLTSVLIGGLIMVSSGRVLRGSLHILIEGVPEGLSLGKISTTISSVPGICEVHDLHVWNICSGHIALSAHVVVEKDAPADMGPTMADVKQRLLSEYGINHTTIQFETVSCGQGQIAVSNNSSR